MPALEWPADKVERRAVADLVPSARNARTHTDAQVAQIAASIATWGWTVPVLVDEAGRLIAGHGRILAAKRLGLTEVPVMVATGWTEEQKRAYLLADNKLALNAGWDDELLALELGELRDANFDVSLIGFSENELSGLRIGGAAGLTDPDDTPDPPADPVTRLGDVWLLGAHRLVCGDSTDADTVAALGPADLCFTSPPYAQQRDYTKAITDWDALMCGVFAAMPVKPSAQVLVNLGLVHRDGEWLPYWDGWIEWMRKQGWRRFGWYVWDQGPGLPGDWNGRLAPSHEFIFHFNREARRANKSKAKLPENVMVADRRRGGMRRKDGSVGGRSNPEASLATQKIADSVFRVMRHKARGVEKDHPAVFPVALAEEVLAAYSKAGDVVFEPFSGSGTTIIAAEMTGRICHAIELSPAYVDVAVKRWEQFTGKTAVRESGR